MAAHSSTLAWKIPWTEEPGGLQSMGSLRVRHDWATSLPLFTFLHWRRKWQPAPVFLPGESQGRGSLVGCRLWGRSHRVRHDWSDLAAAAAAVPFYCFGNNILFLLFYFTRKQIITYILYVSDFQLYLSTYHLCIYMISNSILHVKYNLSCVFISLSI